MNSVIYSKEQLRDLLTPIFDEYRVKRAVLFGSYGKGLARSNSDIDILVDSSLKGLAFVGLIEAIHQATQKDVDLFDVRHIQPATPIDDEIKKTGVLLYETRSDHR